MRNHTDYELNVIAGRISSELTNKENTYYSTGGRSFGYMVSPQAFEDVILKYVESENLSEEDVEALLPKITKKTKIKATSKSIIYQFFETTWWIWLIIIICLIIESV